MIFILSMMGKLFSMRIHEYLDKTYVLKSRKKTYGYACFTGCKEFYRENYPEIVIENGGIDELIMMMTGGDE